MEAVLEREGKIRRRARDVRCVLPPLALRRLPADPGDLRPGGRELGSGHCEGEEWVEEVDAEDFGEEDEGTDIPMLRK